MIYASNNRSWCCNSILFYKNNNRKGQVNALVTVPQWSFQKLLRRPKIWSLGEVFQPKSSTFSKNYFFLPQSVCFVKVPLTDLLWTWQTFSEDFFMKTSVNTVFFSLFAWFVIDFYNCRDDKCFTKLTFI